MRAGRKLFATHGYSAVSGESISARAELTRGALHYQFEDKAGLFRAVVDELLTELLAVLAEETMRDLTDHDR
jgi:AcrR family transcriptional regulator